MTTRVRLRNLTAGTHVHSAFDADDNLILEDFTVQSDEDLQRLDDLNVHSVIVSGSDSSTSEPSGFLRDFRKDFIMSTSDNPDLPNPRLGNQEIEAVHPTDTADNTLVDGLNSAGPSTVLFVAINEFSRLCCASETIEGPELLEALHRKLSNLLPPETSTLRLPRTGFVYVLKNNPTREETSEITTRLTDGMNTTLEVQNETMNLTISIGIAEGTDALSGEKLLDRAQFAHHLAAQNDGNTYTYYDDKKAKKNRNRATLNRDLYTALEDDEFFLCYQPVVSLEDSTLAGAEALIRWDHPERGIVSPGEFIPLAEQTGQVLFLDRWVLQEAVRQSVEWSEELGWDHSIGVNLSAWQFRDDYLLDKIQGILDETGLPPARLKLEITETAIIENFDSTAQILGELKELGVQIALDDFGTGQASFQYLQQFPIDELKIDRSFLEFDDISRKNQNLVDCMIETGQRTNTNILAEGVESPHQLKFLKNRGCQRAQGFLFSKPVESSDFSSLINDNQPFEVAP